MKIFLSYARKDVLLALALIERLTRAGFSVFNPEEEIEPRDNWAKKMGKALAEADLMVVLLTPGAMKSDNLRRDIEFSIASQKYEHRVFTVFVGPTLEAGADMPWILLKLPHHHAESAKGLAGAVRAIRSLFMPSAAGRVHA